MTMPKLTEKQSHNASRRGEPSDVARHMGVCRDVTNWIRVRYSHTGRSCDRPKSARPRATTAARYRYILVNHPRDRFRTTPSTAGHIPGRKTDFIPNWY